MGERYLDTVEVGGSKPPVPMVYRPERALFLLGQMVIGKREVEQGGMAPKTSAGEYFGFVTLEQAVELLTREAARPRRPKTKEV